jgi:hypothetical protein
MLYMKLAPIFISALLLGAHLYRAGWFPLAVICTGFPILLAIQRAWAARSVQISLVIGSLEWVRTLFMLVDARRTFGQPWVRLSIILGLVALFTISSALTLQVSSLKSRYKL